MPVPHEFLVKRQSVAGGERHGSRIGGFALMLARNVYPEEEQVIMS